MASSIVYTDHRELLVALLRLLGTSREQLSPRFRNDHHPISDALADAGIASWSQLVTIRDSDIDDLVYDVTRHGVTVNPGDPIMQPLSIAYKGQIRALIAYYHYESRKTQVRSTSP